MRYFITFTITTLILFGCKSTEPIPYADTSFDHDQARRLLFSQSGYRAPSKCALGALGGYETEEDERFCQNDVNQALEDFTIEIITCEDGAPARYDVYYEIENQQTCVVKWRYLNSSETERVLFYDRNDKLYADLLGPED